MSPLRDGGIGVGTSLTDLWAELQLGATERGIALFRGMPILVNARGEPGPTRTAVWNGELSGFLGVAQAAGVTLAYAEYDEFAYESMLTDVVREELPAFDPTVAVAGQNKSAAWLYERLRERTQEHASRDGQACSVQCVWVKDGIHHRFTSRPGWFENFLVAVADVAAEAEQIGAEDRLVLSAEEGKRIKALADQLARHPRFAEATNEAKRRFVAEQLFPDEPDLYGITSLAEMIYWWDVEPTERATKAQRARELYDSGMSATAIGGVLNMSLAKVRTLLAQSENTD